MRESSMAIGSSVLALCCATTSEAQWVRNPTTGHFYCTTAQLSWKDAEREARFLGGNLVTIDDQAENDWIVQQFGKFAPGADGGLWIGLSDEKKEGTFAWSSGSRSTYTNWNVLQPDNHRGGEHFTHVWGPDVTVLMAKPGKWNDRENLPARASRATGFVGVVEVDALPSFTLFVGRGCSASNPMPLASSADPPVAGRTFRIRLSNLGPPAGGANTIGASDRRWSALPRAFDLRRIGSPECHLLVSWSTASPAFSRFGGMGEQKFSIPALPVLIGSVFYVRAWDR